MTVQRIDRKALHRLLDLIGGDVEDLRELVDDFLVTAPELAGTIRAAVVARDDRGARIAAHTLKSNARDFGALHLSDLCAELEAAIRSDDPSDRAGRAEAIVREEVLVRLDLGGLELAGLGNEV